ncbi:MAG: CPBP family intramembrane metalloprotease [Clostridia bacterium]|nr:CPBP family intramembrane metalloprotease [Clostridia bacterium]
MIKSFSQKQTWLSIISLILVAVLPLGEYLLSLTSLGVGIQYLLLTVVGLALVLLIIWFYCSYVLRVQMSDCYITKPSFNGIWMVIGVGLPIIVFGSMLFCDVTTDFARIDKANSLYYITFLLYNSLTLVVLEETIFRGILLRAFSRLGAPLGILVSSLLCVSMKYVALVVDGLHPLDVSLIDYILFVGGGLVTSAMYCCITLESESIWNSVLVHLLWNACFYGLIGISNSATTDRYIMLTIHEQNSLLTGGVFGIDYSLITICGFAIVALIALVFVRINKRLQSMDE